MPLICICNEITVTVVAIRFKKVSMPIQSKSVDSWTETGGFTANPLIETLLSTLISRNTL